jgi:PAS domain S-box-containing protein
MKQRSGSLPNADEIKPDVAPILDTIPGLVATLTPTGEVDSVNKELVEYCGQAVEDMRQWGTNGTVHVDDLPHVAGVFMQAISAGEPYNFEARIRRFDGVYRWNQVRGLPFRESNGRIVRWYVLLADIDDAKRAEGLLAGEKQLLDLMARAMPLSTVLEALCRTLEGNLPACLCGISLADATVTRLPNVAAPSWSTPIMSSTKTPLGTFAIYFEEPSKPTDEHLTIIERFTHLAAVAIERAHSDEALRRSEAALRVSDERHALAMEAAAEGHFDCDVDTGQMFASARLNEIYDFPQQAGIVNRAEFVRRIPFHPDDRHLLADIIDPGVVKADWRKTPHDFFEYDCRIVPRSGDVRWIRTRGKLVRDAAGRVRRRVGVVADITERKQAEEALRESQQRYARAMLAAEAGFWDWEIPSDTFYASPKLLEMAGLPAGSQFKRRADFMGKASFHPDDLIKWESAVKALFASGGTRLVMELRSVRGGETRWTHMSGLCERDAAGKVVRWTGSASDVTARTRVEEALRLSEERYALAMAASEEGHFDWNVETDEVFTSEHLRYMLGLPPDADRYTRGRLMSEHIPFHPEDRERIEATTRDLLAGTALQHEFEYRLLRGKARELRWIHTRWKLFRTAAGVATRVIGVVSDITDRKRAADELRESEARFRALTALWSDWYWRQDEHLRFTYSTAAIDPPEGYPGGSSIGKTRWELPGIVPLSSSWAEHRRVVDACAPFRDFEYSRPAPDGTLRYVSTSGTPIFDEEGVFRGYHGVGRDITEQKRVEQELRSRQEMLEVAQKAARAVAFEWRVGAGEGENRWSPELEALYGIPAGSYDGTYEAWKSLIHPDDWPNVQAAIDVARQTGDVDAEYRVVHAGGAIRWLQAKGRMFFDLNGKSTRIVGFMLDVTDRHVAEEQLQRMERQLRQAQRLEALGTLAGGIAHDFNNLLGAILGYGEMALRNARAGSRLRRDVENMLVAGERGKALVERILAFSRSGVGERVAVHVEKVVRETLSLFAAKLPRDVAIERRLQAGKAAVMGDPTQIHQVLMNLLTNGVQAMASGGTLRVSLDRIHLPIVRVVTTGSLAVRDYVVMEVADAGSGISPEVLERIFDPFFTTKEVGVGTGLGLSLVHGIVTGLGGAIDVQTAVGSGSIFRVYLPLASDVAVPSKPRQRSTPKPRRTGRGCIMVIDDEAALVSLATATLAELGYSTVGFTSSAKAIEAFLKRPEQFDLVITDESMPGASGSELIRRMRELRPTLPILLVSGYSSPAVVERARRAGATEVLKKPLPARQLQTALERALRLSGESRASDRASGKATARAPRRGRTAAAQSRPARTRR